MQESHIAIYFSVQDIVFTQLGDLLEFTYNFLIIFVREQTTE